jgi:hypothetical protein
LSPSSRSKRASRLPKVHEREQYDAVGRDRLVLSSGVCVLPPHATQVQVSRPSPCMLPDSARDERSSQLYVAQSSNYYPAIQSSMAVNRFVDSSEYMRFTVYMFTIQYNTVRLAIAMHSHKRSRVASFQFESMLQCVNELTRTTLSSFNNPQGCPNDTPRGAAPLLAISLSSAAVSCCRVLSLRS